MPIFDISGDKLSAVEQKNFALEKDLQSLIEKNLETVFNCKFNDNKALYRTLVPHVNDPRHRYV
jgi:hypothetical protein